eukprot:TRINITY_DN5576_c0_g1_i1.p1 TRINITY_DN5576_c0_g1~~TRINITY_DN5576_c0_g1_i1.p1  ORF type:complete len:337 (-),score=162.36 TRINITY_DN5576_c0_g1_i1:237-1247(-)
MVRSHQPLRAFTLICDLGLAPIVFAVPPTDLLGCAAGCGLDCCDPSAPLQLDTASIFSQSLVYLKNMHHLLSDAVLAAAGVALSGDGETAVQERRLALYGAFLLPLAATHYWERGRDREVSKPHPVTRYIISDALKLRARDAEQVHRLHLSALEFQLLLRRTVGAPITDANCAAVQPDRVEAGLVLRRVGELWRMALLLALTGDLGTQHILDSAVRDRADKEADEAIICAYASMGRALEGMGLVGETPVWELKPAIDGVGIGKLLPGLPKGPVFKEILDDQIEWILRNPYGSEGEVKEHVMHKYAQYLCPLAMTAHKATVLQQQPPPQQQQQRQRQ